MGPKMETTMDVKSIKKTTDFWMDFWSILGGPGERAQVRGIVRGARKRSTPVPPPPLKLIAKAISDIYHYIIIIYITIYLKNMIFDML